MTDISTEDYSGTDALSRLLTDLTADVAQLITVLDDTYEDWSVVDIHNNVLHYFLVKEKAARRIYNNFPVDTELPVLSLAIYQELITVDALCRAVAPEYWENKDAIRSVLATGIRTPLSKNFGFRWGDRALDGEEIFEDCLNLADYPKHYKPGVFVDDVTATYEVITVKLVNNETLLLPFDYYPFLGAALLAEEPLFDAADEINSRMT